MLSSKLLFIDPALRTLENTLTRMAAWLQRLVSQVANYPTPETNSLQASENRVSRKERIVFQPPLFRGYVSFREGIHEKNKDA